MKTKQMKKELMRVFGFPSFDKLKEYYKEATSPYPATVDWKCMAIGRRKNGQHCAFGEKIGRDPNVDACYVADHFTYIRFVGEEFIYRFVNPPDMVHQIRHFDEHGMFDNMEEGDSFILEPPGKARSRLYSIERREKIRAGLHIVKKRGPNINPRREPVHFFRPY
jgi:hypothetical protein